MPKLKTHRGAAKRFSLTGTGKVRRSRAFMSHILTKKSQKRKRSLRRTGILNESDAPGIKKLIPYL